MVTLLTKGQGRMLIRSRRAHGGEDPKRSLLLLYFVKNWNYLAWTWQAKERDPGYSHMGLYWKSNYLGYFPNEFHV